MANQAEVTKLNQHLLVAPPANNASVTKLTMYVFAVPGNSPDTSGRQGHVHTQIVRR